MWLERKLFPALELGHDEGIIAVTTGVKARDLGDQKKGGGPAQSSLRRIDVANMHGIGGIYQHRPVALRAGCSRVSMRRVRTAHRAVATRRYLSADRSERRLRRQTLDAPRFAFARVAKAIMQAVGAALPEFDSLRFHPITAPVRWTGNFLAGKSLF